MASAIIHMAVGKCIGDIIGKNSKAFFLGTIAPDISKIVGQDRDISHFVEPGKKSPNIKRFIEKYHNDLHQDFEFGYLVHLYTDKFWIEKMIPTFTSENQIKTLDGTIITYKEDKILDLIYNDYTNINISTIEDHDLDLSLFYEEFSYPNTVITEIPKEFRKLLDKMGIIIENSKEEKHYLFNQETINYFIEECSMYILKELKKNHILITP